MPRFGSLLLTLLCLFVFAGRAAHAAEAAPRDKDLKRAETVVAKLRRLEASAGDAASYRKAAAKVFPGLFRSVSSLREGDTKTDLSTAAALYESAYRASDDGARPDCSRELRAVYSQLCRESDTRTHLLFAKARLHTRFGESAILYARGDRSPATLDTLAELRAERATDQVLAGEALRALKELAAGLTDDNSSARSRRATDDSARTPDAQRAHALGEVERIIASLPRCHIRQLLANARDAFRDHLFWQLKGAPARALVVNVNSLDAPDPLRPLNLSASDATRASLQNLRAALKFIAKAEAAIKMMNAE